MQDVLSEIKRGAKGVKGSFVVNGNGQVVFSDIEGLNRERIDKAAFNLSFFMENAAGRKIERLQIATEKGNLIFVSEKDAAVGCITEKDANLGLIYLFLKKGLSVLKRDGVKVEEAPKTKPAPAGAVSAKIIFSADCRGMHCPLPVANMRRGLNKINSGELIELITTDPASPKDIPAAAVTMGAEVIKLETTNKPYVSDVGKKYDVEYRFVIKKH